MMFAKNNKKGNKFLIIIIAIFFIKSMFWLFTIPIFQTPDENRHYDYIVHLAKKHKLPVGETAIHGKAVYMEETLFLEKITDFDLVHFKTRAKSQFIFRADSIWQEAQAYPENFTISDVTDPENISVNYYPPLYYLIGAGIYHIGRLLGGNIIVRFYLLRLFQVFTSILAIIIVWKIFKLLHFSLFFRTIYFLIFTFWPQLCIFTIGLQPDVLGMLIVVLIIYLYILNFNNRVRYFYILLGILLGFLMFVKIHYSMAMFSSIIIFHTLYYFLKYKKLDLKLLISAVIAILIATPWLIHNLTYYNMFLPHADLEIVKEPSVFKQFWLVITVGRIFTFPSTIGYFGWVDTRLPEFIYNIYYVLIFISILSFGFYCIKLILKYVALFSERDTSLNNLVESSLPYYIIYSSCFLFLGTMFYISMTISPWLVDQGRHYFPFVFALLLIFVRYSRDAFKFLRLSNIYLVALTIFVFLSSILSFIIVWKRYYID